MLATALPFPLRTVFASACFAIASLQAFAAIPATQSAPTSAPSKAQIAQRYGQLPLSFEANQGQADKSVKFLSRGSGYGLYLTRQDAVLTLHKPGSASRKPNVAPTNRHSKPVGIDPLPGAANYFVGNDPARWRGGVPTYARRML
jgi:hypothetical protein